MGVSSRVQADQSDKIADYENHPDGTSYVIGPYRGGFAVYADHAGYSQTSGQTLKRGPVERDCAGKPVRFNTIKGARAWVRAALPLLNSRGDEVDPIRFEQEGARDA